MIKDKLARVPQKPGSYQLKDNNGQIIYVGKAKNLKSRLSSYFTGSHDYKTTKMLTNVTDFDYIITGSELEALILELDLIKKHQPRYNILLTDDKSYPYIEITQEKHPKMVVTRKVKSKHKNLFGPFPNVKAARDTIQVLNKLYPLRQCQVLPDEPCLYYHLGQCLAPCINKVSQDTYRNIEQEIRTFLKGKTTHVVSELKEKMYDASENLEYERAQEYKTMIDAIHTTTRTDQAVNINDTRPLDIIGYSHDDEAVALTIFFVRNGKIAASDKRLFKLHGAFDAALRDFLGQFYTTYPTPSEVLIDIRRDVAMLSSMLEVPIKVPKRGLKRKMLNLAIQNAEDTLKIEKDKLQKEHEKTFGVLDELGELLDIKTPYHIEAFDNSHLFGEYPVSALVVFKNAKPAKNDYRKYKLSATEKQSGDTDQMKEVLYRRFRRIIMDKLPIPDLILLDGGIQQMSVARTLRDTFDLPVPLAALVKDKKHKTSHLLDESGTTYDIKAGSALYRLLATIQEEAHRFAITFHQEKRHKGLFASVLDDIEGVGKKTKDKLLKQFKTVNAINKASEEELKALGINEKIIKNIKNHLNKT